MTKVGTGRGGRERERERKISHGSFFKCEGRGKGAPEYNSLFIVIYS